MMVVLGHSVALLINHLCLQEQVFAVILAKFTGPCVFIFVFLLGYGQGLKRKRLSKPQVIQRVISVGRPYLFWATLSFILYMVLQDPYWYPYTGRGLFGGLPMIAQYPISLVSFTINWQYYFLFLYMFFLSYAYLTRHHSDQHVWTTTKFLLVFHILFTGILTGFLWFGATEAISLSMVAAFIYPNPLAWGFVFYLGLHMGSKKLAVLPVKSRLELPLYMVLWAFGAFELFMHLRRWGGAAVSDQFTLSGFAFALVSLVLLTRIATRWTLSMANGKSCWWKRWIIRFGKQSLMIFLLHLPFQWFALMMIENLLGMQLSSFVRIPILFITGLFFPYMIGTIAKRLPEVSRKIITGF